MKAGKRSQFQKGALKGSRLAKQMGIRHPAIPPGLDFCL